MGQRSILAVLCAMAMHAQAPAPPLRGETLDGKKVVLAGAAAGKVTVLAIGFSKKAGDLVGPWRDRIAADFGSDARAEYFEVAFLEDAPSLVRGMIKSAMRSGTPVAQRPHFLVAVTDEAAWKKFTRITDDKLPAVVVLDGSGQLRWSGNGEFEASRYAALKEAATALIKK